jgi:hypothetical protein
MLKLFALTGTSLVGLALTALLPPSGPGGPPPRPDAKKKGLGAAVDLRKAYDAIRRVRADEGRGGAAEERLRDWAERAAGLYRKGVRAMEDGDERLAHEYGAMAHDLARAADHADNAARWDRHDDNLPPPPSDGAQGDRERTLRDLRHAFDRIREIEGQDPPSEGRFYLDAARDLYRAARRDAENGHLDRAGELARAAETMSHVPEHMIHAERGPDGPPPPDRKAERKRPLEPRGDLPPPID